MDDAPLCALVTEARLLCRTSSTRGRFYNFYCYRDPALAGTPDLIEAQRLFGRTALAHMRAFIIQSLAFVAGDPHSLAGRDPVGA